MVKKEHFRKVMAKFATGVTVVSTQDQGGHFHGMTANAFSSVCLEPPLVLVCVAHDALTYRYLDGMGSFGVSILTNRQRALADYFSSPPEERQDQVEFSYSITPRGYLALNGALAFLGCRVVASHDHGDHTIFIAQVEEMYRERSSKPLLFFESRYNNLDSIG